MKEKTADIDILEELVNGFDNLISYKQKQAIEILIAENKELKEENDSLKKEIIHWKGEYHLENRKYLDLYNKKVSIPKINATEEMLEQYVEKVKIIKVIEELEKDENLINAEYFIKRLQSLLGKE